MLADGYNIRPAQNQQNAFATALFIRVSKTKERIDAHTVVLDMLHLYISPNFVHLINTCLPHIDNVTEYVNVLNIFCRSPIPPAI